MNTMFPDCLHANRNFIYKQGKESRTQNTPLFDTKGKIKIFSHLVMYTYTENDCFGGIQKRARSMNAKYNFPPVLLKYFSVVADKVVYGKYPFLKPACVSTTTTKNRDHPFTLSVYFVKQSCSTCLSHSAIKSLCNCSECLCLLF